MLIGGGLGLIGVLTGAVLALWWKSKFAKVEGQLSTLALKLKQEQKEHDETLKRAQEAAEKFEDGNQRKDELIEDLKGRLSRLREREVADADLDTLINLVNSLPQERGGEVANKDSSSSNSVHGDKSTGKEKD